MDSKASIASLSLIAAALLLMPVASQARPQLTVVGSADVTGDRTEAIAVNGATDHVYLAGGFVQPDVAIVDFTTVSSPSKTVVAMPPLVGVTVNAATNTWYAYRGFVGGRVVELDGTDNLPNQESFDAANGCGGSFDINNTTGDVYMTTQCSDSVHRYDPATNFFLSINALGEGVVAGNPVVNEATGQVYVNTSVGVRVYSEELALITTLPSSIQAVNEVTNRLYFTIGDDLVIVDGTTHEELDRIAGINGFVAVDTGSNEFFVSESGNEFVLAYDGATNAQIDTFSLGTGVTTGVIVSDDAGRAYVTSFDAAEAATLSALEWVESEVIFDMDVPGKAIGITNLRIGGEFFNVDFTPEVPAGLVYGDFPSLFDFITQDAAAVAVIAANETLNAEGGVFSVGGVALAVGRVNYLVGYESELEGNVERVLAWEASTLPSDDVWSIGLLPDAVSYAEPRVWATFTVPEPGSALSLALALASVGAVARRRRATA